MNKHADIQLYHTKKQKGTKTNTELLSYALLLYHTKKQKGTKTVGYIERLAV